MKTPKFRFLIEWRNVRTYTSLGMLAGLFASRTGYCTPFADS